MAQRSPELLTDLLKQVSRSFYLTLRVLPQQVRPQISLAYLLARTSDTIADTEILPLEGRLQSLDFFRKRALGLTDRRLNFSELAHAQVSEAERILLERCEESIALLNELAPADRLRIREVLDTIISGQELDLRRFSGASETRIVALGTETELDDYTYRVAGCVGEFWTKMCLAHLFSTEIDEALLLANGIRFGKGLQLVNILRDLPRDLRQGRCYMPRERLNTVPLVPEDLLNPANEQSLRPVYNEFLALAASHLRAGWNYTNALPLSQMRVRLACAWPVLIGARTVQKLRAANVLDPALRIKVSRAEVWGIMMGSVLKHPFPAAWHAQWPEP